MVNPISKQSVQKLYKEQVRINKQVVNLYGTSVNKEVQIFRNPDPVLMYLANSDESEFRKMERNNTSISTARKNIDSLILEKGYSIKRGPGSKNKKPAKLLKEFIESALRSAHMFNLVRKLALDFIYWGWRPFEVVYRTDFKFKGQSRWAPYKIIEKVPEMFRFTLDRNLVYLDEMNNSILYDINGKDAAKFAIFTFDSINNPYGKARYSDVWLLDHVKQRFLELFSIGMQRSFGVIKASEMASAPGAKSADNIVGEIEDIIEYLNSNNVLVSKSGWTLEILSDIKFSEGWVQAIEYLDRNISSAVAIGSLSYEQGAFSSRSQASVHSDSSKRDAVVSAIQADDNFTKFIRTVCDLNFADIDPDDYPSFSSRITEDVDIKLVEAMANMGAPIDLDYYAEFHNVKLADENTKNASIPPGRGPGKPETARTTSKEKEIKADEEARSERDRSDEN